MEPLLIYPDPVPPELAQALDLGGYPWKAVAGEAVLDAAEPEDGWSGAIVVAADDPDGAFAVCRSLRKRDLPLEPLLVLVTGAQLADLELRDDLFDDFCLYPFQPRELDARLKHLFWRTGRGTRPELIEYGELVLNLETYQAACDGRPLDPTASPPHALSVSMPMHSVCPKPAGRWVHGLSSTVTIAFHAGLPGKVRSDERS